MFFKVIACEIVLREICFLAAQSPHMVDLEFLPQGYHDNPVYGKNRLQERLDAVPGGKYDAVLLGYALCGNIINGLRAGATRVVVPRGHDCITFFLGSKERYLQQAEECPGAYYYSCGWLECMSRRGGDRSLPQSVHYLPARAGVGGSSPDTYQEWVKKYGEEEAKFLVEAMNEWTDHYTHGVLIDYDFTKGLRLHEQVQEICQKRGWSFKEVAGDLKLMRNWLAGDWPSEDFLVLQPGEEVAPSYDERVIMAKKGA
jgi:hypothetical protein